MMIDQLALLATFVLGPVWNPVPVTPIAPATKADAPVESRLRAMASFPPASPVFGPSALIRPEIYVAAKPKLDAQTQAPLPSRSWEAPSLKAVFEAAATVPGKELRPKPILPKLSPPLTSGNSAIKVVNPPVKPAPKPVEDKLCNVVAAGADLSDVLNMLSEQANVNVLLLQPGESKITVRLVNVKLMEALTHLCAVTGMQVLKTGNAFVMGSAEKLQAGYPKEWAKHVSASADATPAAPTKDPAPEAAPPKEDPIITRVYSVNHVDPMTLADSLKALFGDEKFTVAAGPKPKTPELMSANAGGGTDTQGTMAAAGERFARTLILRGPESKVLAAIDTAKQLDTSRQQVSIAVTIHDVNDGALRDLGLTYTPGGTTVSEGDPRGLNFGSFVRTPLSFNVGIRTAEKNDKAKLLASPNVTVMDQEKAFVLIGNRINLPRLERIDNNGSPVYTSVEYRAGVYLQVSPMISDTGEITLTLYPQVSTITSTNEINGAAYPNIATRESQTTLTVRSGETIVMGGLLRDEEIKEMERVPILGQIPFFGELFTRRRNQKTKSQVIISITPVLVKPDKP